MQPSSVPAGLSAGQNELQGPSCSGGSSVQRLGYVRPKAGLNAQAKAGPRKRGVLAPKGAMEHPKTKVVVLPPAGREEQYELWGLTPERLGDHLFKSDRLGHGPDDAVTSSDLWDDPEQAARELEERGFVIEGGWHAVEPPKGSERGGGTTSHRGVIHPDEYVDPEVLRAVVERELGFTYEQVRSVYRQGPLSVDGRELRGRVDARLLALSRSGGNMAELGRALGFPVKSDGHCRVVENALTRARAAE